MKRGVPSRMLLALLMALTACGARVSPDTATREQNVVTENVDPGVQPLSAPSPLPKPQPRERVTQTAPSADSEELGDPEETFSFPPHNTDRVTINLSHSCVEPGDLLLVSLKGPSEAGFGATISFADGQAHGAWKIDQTDKHGRHEWPVQIDTSMPPGEATVLISMTGPNGTSEGSGSADKAFQVAGLGGC